MSRTQTHSSPDEKSAATRRQTIIQFLILAGLLVGVTGLTVYFLDLLNPAQATAAPVAQPIAASTPFNAAQNLPPTASSPAIVERNTAALTTPIPTLTPVITPTLAPVTPIPWTEEDFNALTWLCYEEVRGMREARYDACLSVIATVRQRYAYENAYTEGGIQETLLRENQFPITFHLDRPAPDEQFQEAVQQYQWGARGSCTGYLYYDSVPGGPSICVIESSNGSFVEFHRGWR